MIETSYIIDGLTKYSATVITIRTYNGEQLGKPHAELFTNTAGSLARLKDLVSDEIYVTLTTYWGEPLTELPGSYPK